MPKKLSYTESKSGGYFKAPVGGHPAIIVGIMELGTEMKSFKDKAPRPVTEVRIIFEIEAEQEKYENGNPTGIMEDKIGVIGQNYTEIISDSSNLGDLITSVYEVKELKEIKDFTLDKLLGVKCFIDVEHKGDKKYANIKSVSAYNKKVNYHEQVRESFYFGLADENDFNEDLLEDKDILRLFDKERIIGSPEYKKLFGIETLDEQEANMEAEAKAPATLEEAQNVFGE